MSSFAERSFLFALYFPNEDSGNVPEFVKSSEKPILLSRLVAFEFRHAVWFEVFRREHGDMVALSRERAHSGLASFEIDLDAGVFRIVQTDLDELLDKAFHLTDEYTLHEGIRSTDTLHLAAAKLLGCTEFLTFDKLQRRVAELEGFAVSL